MGCLTALELYTPQGELQQGDMAEILRVLDVASGGTLSGYLLVVEWPEAVGMTEDTAWLQPYVPAAQGVP